MEQNPHYVTPEQAENRICIQSLVVLPLDSTEAAPCEGPRCMAWRWEVKFNYDKETKEVIDTYSTTHGYCGLVQT